MAAMAANPIPALTADQTKGAAMLSKARAPIAPTARTAHNFCRLLTVVMSLVARIAIHLLLLKEVSIECGEFPHA
jgi:hypothetical protein